MRLDGDLPARGCAVSAPVKRLPATPLLIFLGLLERAGGKFSLIGERASFQCPCHDDQRASASCEPGRKQPLVAHCNAGGCGASLPEMLEKLGATAEERAAIIGGNLQVIPFPDFDRCRRP